MRLLLGIVLFWAVTAADQNGVEVLFPRSAELVYATQAHVSTGVSAPAAHVSYFGIRANLRVRTDREQTASFALENVTFTSYNGAGTSSKLPASPGEPRPPQPEEDAALALPFTVTYHKGMVASLAMDPADRPWSRNLKRSVVSQFQLDLEQIHFKAPAVFTSREGGVSGEVSVENTLTAGRTAGGFHLTKDVYTKELAELQSFYTEEVLVKYDPVSGAKSPVERSTERGYSLVRTGTDRFLKIEQIRARSLTALLRPAEAPDNREAFYNLVNQTFSLISVNMAPSSRAPNVSELAVTFDLTAEMPDLDPASGADPDFTLGRQQPNTTRNLNTVTSLLTRTARRLEERPRVSAEPGRLHDLDLSLLLANLRLLDYAVLSDLTDKALRGKSSSEVRQRKLLLGLLPRVGTRAALLVSRDLVVTPRKGAAERASELLEEMPFHLRFTDPGVLKECESLLRVKQDKEHDVRTEAALSFASLVGKVCSKPGACPPELVSKYVAIFTSKVEASSDYQGQLVGVLALANMGLPPVLDFLEPLVLGSLKAHPGLPEFSHRLRSVALTAAKHAFLARGPKRVYSTLWPLLADRGAHLELRVATLSVLLEAEPTSRRLLAMLGTLSSENNPQLYNLFYTSVRALADSDNPHYARTSGAARRVVDLMPEPSSPRYADTWHRVLAVPSLLAGAGHVVAQVTAVADPATGIANLVHLNFLGHEHGRDFSPLGVYMRFEGLPELTSDLVMSWRTRGAYSVSALSALLKSLGVSPREQQKPRLEAVMFKQGRATNFYTVDTNIFKHLNQVVKVVVAKVSGSFQKNMLSVGVEEPQLMFGISDLGWPLVIEREQPFVASASGNLAADTENVALMQAAADLEIRYASQTRQSVRAYNPVSALWHGVALQSALELYVPLRAAAALDLVQRNFKLKFDWNKDEPLLSVLGHSRRQTEVTGAEEELALSCPNCTQTHEVTAGPRRSKSLLKTKVLDSQLQIQAELFDCERPQTVEHWTNFLGPITSGRSANVMELRGPCGFKMAATYEGEASSLDIVMESNTPPKQTERAAPQRVIHAVASYRDKNDKVLSSYDAKLSTETSPDSANIQGQKLKITGQAKNGSLLMLCYEDETRFPAEVDAWSTLYNAPRSTSHNVTLTWGQVTSADSACPTQQHRLQLAGSSRALPPSPSTWPRCEQDLSRVYPATRACGAAADQSLTDRNFTLHLHHQNVSSHLEVSPWLPVPETLTLEMQTRGGHVTSYSLTSPEHPTSESATLNSDSVLDSALSLVAVSLAGKSSPLQGPLGSLTRGLGRRCTLAGGRVLTFDNSSVELSATSDYTLMAADCRKSPVFGVFVRKVSGTHALGVRLIILDEEVEVTPGSSGSKPSVKTSNPDPDKAQTIVTSDWSGRVTVTSKSLDEVRLSYSASAITLTAPWQLGGVVCGMCGNLDSVPEDSHNFPGPQGWPVPLSKLPQAYTLKSHSFWRFPF